MELQGALHDAGLNFTEIPEGRPCDTAKTTGFDVEPGILSEVLVLPPCATVLALGVNESEKLPDCAANSCGMRKKRAASMVRIEFIYFIVYQIGKVCRNFSTLLFFTHFCMRVI